MFRIHHQMLRSCLKMSQPCLKNHWKYSTYVGEFKVDYFDVNHLYNPSVSFNSSVRTIYGQILARQSNRYSYLKQKSLQSQNILYCYRWLVDKKFGILSNIIYHTSILVFFSENTLISTLISNFRTNYNSQNSFVLLSLSLSDWVDLITSLRCNFSCLIS